MPLRIYNSLTRQKEAFSPLEPGKVKMYVCGVTVYDYCHLGHARAYIVWDMVRRYLATKYEVRYVQNITDIDDKILQRAREQDTTMQSVAERFIAAYDEDMAKLNVLPADDYPRATAAIAAILDLIQALVDRDYAYASGGDVYYAVQRFPSYGKLSGRKLEDMQAGASGRVDDREPHKRYPFDFALWKAAKPGEPSWESPWGNGRPGWHIECSAMVRSAFGDRLDIHAGGADLQFPHHENEIAQSEAVTQQPLANVWMHNGFVNIDGEKMSKSLHNFKTIRDLLQHFEPMAVRLFILQAHYRQPIDFTEEAIAAATKGWETIREGLLFGTDFGHLVADRLDWETLPEPSQLRQQSLAKFDEAMEDDFNTAVALAQVFELAKSLRTERNLLVHSGKPSGESEGAVNELHRTFQTLKYLAATLGFPTDKEHLAAKEAVASVLTAAPIISDTEIESMIQQRREARLSKNWSESDRLRDALKEVGITLIDRPDGTTRWHR